MSGKAANVPHLTAAGIGYSTPYLLDAGIIALVREPEVAGRVRAAIGRHSGDGPTVEAREAALRGLTVAVQDGRSPSLYALTRLQEIRLVACETLAGALDSADASIEIVLTKEPIAAFYLSGRSARSPASLAWEPLVLESGEPLVLARECYAIAMAETNYPLRWLVNDVLFELERSGRLAEMRRRWFDPDSASSQQARAAGLPCPACTVLLRVEGGRCRQANAQ